MRVRAALFAACLAALTFGQPPARADVVILADPDKWIEQALKDISDGKTDQFARNFLVLIDNEKKFDSFAGNLKVLSRIAPPLFVEKVQDVRFGTVLREVNFVALYGQNDYIYFKFTMKKNRGGWLISNFEFKSEPADLFPKDFASPQ